MRKNIFLLIMSLLSMLSTTSCLKSGLDEIEDSNLCELVSVSMEYRWLSNNANGYEQLSRQQLTLSSNTPNEQDELSFSITVPPASTTFPADVRDNVSLDNLYLIAIISPAAKVEPIGTAPKFGTPAKWQVGQSYEYRVTAANGNRKIFTITIDSFNK